MERLSSRKLAAVFLAISGIVGILLGLAVIEPTALVEPVSVGLIGLAIIAISGLGGFLVRTQGLIDIPQFQFDEPDLQDIMFEDLHAPVASAPDPPPSRTRRRRT